MTKSASYIVAAILLASAAVTPAHAIRQIVLEHARGTVEEVLPANQQIRVNGVSYRVSDGTRFQGASSLGGIYPGETVEIEFMAPAADNMQPVATRIAVSG